MAVTGAVAFMTALLAVVLIPNSASAHGAMMTPGSRTFFCWQDGLSPQGNIVPINQACSAAVAQSGANSLYNWFSVLRSDGAGRTTGFIPDGQACSGGNPGYSGFDLPSSNWPVTHLTSGANIQFKYNKWAAHPGWFYLYITKDGWNPNRALTWGDLETQPFHTADHPQSVGNPGTNDANYYWNATLPSGKSGRHIIYSVWKRSDSAETFYNCSDVVFDGGSGQVTGVGRGGTTTPPPTTPTPTPPTTPTPTPTPTVTPPPTGGGGCTATYRTTGSWSGGFQAEVTVSNPSSSSINGWTAKWTLGSGSAINSLWNGTFTASGANVTAKNADWNRTLAGGGSTTFGFTASGTSGSPTVTCTSP
ncbi:lytic polysaccharide monooxygenase [Streptosporangium sp. 'caverna']|uniref:lytic polysaccharide monooxygenase auxiliary activity family 9 protein n=1 Tax=Streptosporangium sp. 'caverna' TaxID=2202249 RepID=UPI000D7DBD96|nr:lytic polysaccharide monooxygenase [Streptosporangium sp. 'caverna']AWS45973.1 chitin-binding protein [Streptosporangium sp. 'caverna']